jgi:hypothetical protein
MKLPVPTKLETVISIKAKSCSALLRSYWHVLESVYSPL